MYKILAEIEYKQKWTLPKLMFEENLLTSEDLDEVR